MTENRSYLVPGFHGVRETLRGSGIRLKALWIAEGKTSSRVRELVRAAEAQGIPISMKPPGRLRALFPDVAHQGIVGVLDEFPYTSLSQLIERCLPLKGQGLVMAADHITDGGNLGAMIRTAAYFGAHGLVIPKDRSARVDSKVMKRSSGGHMYVPIARVVNLARALDRLKEAGFWVIGASGEASQSIFTFDWTRDVVLIAGNEQQGLSQAVRRRCHEVVSIPVPGEVASLNVSVACGIILSEIYRQRKVAEVGRA